MSDRKSVLVHIHVSQADGCARAGSGSVKAVVGAPGTTHTVAVQGGSGSATGPTGHRSWAVAFHGRKYLVVDAGGRGITITRDGATVWTGQRLASGGYTTGTTTVPHDQLERLLRRVGVGDARTPRVEVREAPRARPSSEPSSAPRSLPPARAKSSRATQSKSLSEAQRASLARGRAVRAERRAASQATGDAAPRPASTRRRKPTAKKHAAPTTSTTSSTTPTTSRSTAKPATGRSGAAPAARRKPGRPREPRAAGAAAAASAKRSDPAPATTRSMRHASVDDAAVLAEVKKKVKRDDPDNAATLYAALERIWFAGGKEQTLAWMTSHKIATVVDAFSDWVDKHPDAARRLLEKTPHSRRGAAA